MLAQASGPRGEVVEQYNDAKRPFTGGDPISRHQPRRFAMIAVEERPAPPPLSRPTPADNTPLQPRKRALVTRFSSVVLVAALLSTIGGGGLVDSGGAYALQARAVAIHAHWDYMRANGIPDVDLAPLEQEWTMSQASKIVGAGTLFWLPGGAETLDRWQAASDAIWASDLSRYRTDALTAEQSLHRALAPESFVQRKSRLEAFDSAVTPLDFSTLRDEWTLEGKLVPIDRRMAALTAAVAGQVQQAKTLGIRSDPAADVLANASSYTNLDALGRMSRAEFLTRSLVSLQSSLQARLDVASVAQQNLQHATDETSLAALYGIGVSSYQSRLETDRGLYANALTVAQFNAVTADTQQIAASADHDIYVVMSHTHIISGVSFIYQSHPLSCEEAATSMALTHQGINLSQDQILARSAPTSGGVHRFIGHAALWQPIRDFRRQRQRQRVQPHGLRRLLPAAGPHCQGARGAPHRLRLHVGSDRLRAGHRR